MARQRANVGDARSLSQIRSFNCNSVVALRIVAFRKLVASLGR